MQQFATAAVAAERGAGLAAEASQYLTFLLQEQIFGLNIQPIKEICEYAKITPVPMLPDYIRGVINLRGQVVPVIDLPLRFGWEASVVNKRTCIVIVEVDTGSGVVEVGMVIDSVSEVIDIPPADIGTAPSFGAKVCTDFMSGMARVGDDYIVLLNVGSLIPTQGLSALEQLSQSSEGSA